MPGMVGLSPLGLLCWKLVTSRVIPPTSTCPLNAGEDPLVVPAPPQPPVAPHPYFTRPSALLLRVVQNLSKGLVNSGDGSTNPRLEYGLRPSWGPRLRLPQRGNQYN